MRQVKRFAQGVLRACVRTIGGTFVGLLLALVLFSQVRSEIALLLALPMALSSGTLALLWPFAFGTRKRRRRL